MFIWHHDTTRPSAVDYILDAICNHGTKAWAHAAPALATNSAMAPPAAVPPIADPAVLPQLPAALAEVDRLRRENAALTKELKAIRGRAKVAAPEAVPPITGANTLLEGHFEGQQGPPRLGLVMLGAVVLLGIWACCLHSWCFGEKKLAPI